MNQYYISILIFTNLLSDGYCSYLGPQDTAETKGGRRFPSDSTVEENSHRSSEIELLSVPIGEKKDFIGEGLGPSSSDETNNRKKWMEGARRFVEESEKLLKKVHDQFNLNVENPNGCPPSQIKLAGLRRDIKRVNWDHVYKTGSGTSIFSIDKKYVLKHVYDNSLAPIEGLAYDHAFMKVFAGEGIAPEVYELTSYRSFPADCAVRLLVSEFGGSHTLKDLSEIEPEEERKKVLFHVAAEALKILKIIHSRGLIHGDVHNENFVYKGTVPTNDLRIIDFGRAEPFVDLPDGRKRERITLESSLPGIYPRGKSKGTEKRGEMTCTD